MSGCDPFGCEDVGSPELAAVADTACGLRAEPGGSTAHPLGVVTDEPRGVAGGGGSRQDGQPSRPAAGSPADTVAGTPIFLGPAHPRPKGTSPLPVRELWPLSASTAEARPSFGGGVECGASDAGETALVDHSLLLAARILVYHAVLEARAAREESGAGGGRRSALGGGADTAEAARLVIKSVRDARRCSGARHARRDLLREGVQLLLLCVDDDALGEVLVSPAARTTYVRGEPGTRGEAQRGGLPVADHVALSVLLSGVHIVAAVASGPLAHTLLPCCVVQCE